jgi:DNA polymerase elongation subunit (family B)
MVELSEKDILSEYIKYLNENPLKRPISGLDYSSLYPSLIMAYNLSPEYLIVDKKYKEEIEKKGYNIHNIKFEYNYTDYLGNEKSKDIIAWTVRHDESNKENTMFGLYPSILRDLFKQRAEMKKELAIYKDKKEHIEKYETEYENTKEYKECIFKLNYCDTKQKALKVFMNTFYGVMGTKTSSLFQLPLAGGVTSSGQYNLLLIKNYVESLDHKVYYGDSVTGDTPIIIKKNNLINIIPIEELNWNDKEYEKYNDDKEIIIDNETEVYTENGWTKIKKCIRHYTNKKLYRITTHTGSVIVTEDHSLLNEDNEKIKPEDCKIGTKLLHWDNIDLNNFNSEYNINNLINRDVIICSNKLEVQKIYLTLLKYNYSSKIKYISETEYKIYINKTISEFNKSIKKIEFFGYSNDYVYDLETESHHFAAGIGQLVVHNTDSLYISCPDKNYIE